jgi:hypothetical protein
MRNIIAETPCAPQQTMTNFHLNWSLDVAERARITNRSIALPAMATACVSDARIALSTLILAVSLVLLPGAVWMHAT